MAYEKKVQISNSKITEQKTQKPSKKILGKKKSKKLKIHTDKMLNRHPVTV